MKAIEAPKRSAKVEPLLWKAVGQIAVSERSTRKIRVGIRRANLRWLGMECTEPGKQNGDSG